MWKGRPGFLLRQSHIAQPKPVWLSTFQVPHCLSQWYKICHSLLNDAVQIGKQSQKEIQGDELHSLSFGPSPECFLQGHRSLLGAETQSSVAQSPFTSAVLFASERYMH